MSRSEFTYDKLEEIKTYLMSNDIQSFLSLQSIEETEGHVVLTFHFSEHLKPVAAIKQETYVVKLAIAQAILLDEIVTKEPFHVSLHPATVFYHPMSTILYGYRANRVMPKEEKYTHLQRYKALILMILTNYPYEKCLTEPERLEKKANDLVRSVLFAKTMEEMKELLTEAYDFVAYHTVKVQVAEQRKWRNRTIFGIVLMAILSLGTVGYVKYDANEQQHEALGQLEATYEVRGKRQQADAFFEQGNYKEAIPLFLTLGDSSKEVSKKLFEKEEWQLALNTEPKMLEQVIAQLYTNNDEKVVLDLRLSTDEEALTQKLAHEKAIVSYDVAQMTADLPFISNVETLQRMGQTFIANGDMAGAREVLNKTQDATLQSAIELAQINSEVAMAKEKMTTIKSKDSPNQADQLKVQQTKIEELEAKIQELEEG
ncbi:type VII secretion protein EssB/YukC [Sporosarcina limicola]|uniref:Type VII secretion protein EssB n=1 Tax=Sporosarcina limicola TaxID=34101 RepID=A0A927R6F1_9BACL|nr:type VII secretion protein EssB/YukC [Sporosarcina limicola]MBE1557118.1 hypothetical protein [Sporosarcina limicola]